VSIVEVAEVRVRLALESLSAGVTNELLSPGGTEQYTPLFDSALEALLSEGGGQTGVLQGFRLDSFEVVSVNAAAGVDWTVEVNLIATLRSRLTPAQSSLDAARRRALLETGVGGEIAASATTLASALQDGIDSGLLSELLSDAGLSVTSEASVAEAEVRTPSVDALSGALLSVLSRIEAAGSALEDTMTEIIQNSDTTDPDVPIAGSDPYSDASAETITSMLNSLWVFASETSAEAVASLEPLVDQFSSAAAAAAEAAAATEAARTAVAEGEAEVARYVAQLASTNAFLEALSSMDDDSACQLSDGDVNGTYKVEFEVVSGVSATTDDATMSQRRRRLLQTDEVMIVLSTSTRRVAVSFSQCFMVSYSCQHYFTAS
jgi:uncharacterized membrane protein (GlpM family)